MVLLAITLHPVTLAQGGPQSDNGGPYVVSHLTIEYVDDDPRLPSIESLLALSVELAPTKRGWRAAQPEAHTQPISLHAINELEEQRFHASAIQAIAQRIHRRIGNEGLVAVRVRPHPDDIDPERFEDLRAEDRTALRIAIQVGRVTETRTTASGDRIPEDERVNHPSHERIAATAPVRPHPAPEGKTSLVDRAALDDHLYLMNRHPGRRVDVALSRAKESDGLALDYMIHERKPWLAHYEISNTGTPTTHRWRHRFGFQHFQLTDRDDILSLDYVSAGDFDQVHAVMGSYESPLFADPRLRGRVYGMWSRFDSSEVGIFEQQFSGEDWNVGGELIWNVHQDGPLFIDVLGGATWYDIEIEDNSLLGTNTGHAELLIPHVGLRFERAMPAATTRGEVKLAINATGATSTDEADLEQLQRADPDDDFAYVTGSLSQSMFLEPLLWRDAWRDTSTPASSTLGHELLFNVRGQYAFTNRLIPRKQDVVGGMRTVRGYPQSAVSGDTTLLATAEYRMHVPRLLGMAEETPQTGLFGRPFRWRREQPYGSADWNLMLRGFVDVGRVINNPPRTAAERNETLVGAGLGVEFTLRHNVSVRADWGRALSGVEGSRSVRPGNDEVHFSTSIRY